MLVLLLALFIVLYTYLLKKRTKHIPPLAEGCLPIVGHTFKILCNPKALHKLITELSIKSFRSGGTFTFRIVGEDMFGLTDPEDAHTVLSSCVRKDVIYDYLKPFLGEGLLTATETIWKKNRKLLNPTFNQVVLLNYLPEFNKQARTLLYDFDAKEEHVKFDHTVAVGHMTLQVICSTAMGDANDEEDKLLRQQYLNTLSITQRGVIARAQTFWLHSDFIYKYLSNLSKRQTELAKTLFKLTNTVIKKRRTDMKINETQKHFKPFLEHLLCMTKDGTLTDTEVKDETDTFTAAGTDTTSVTLSIALLAIGSFPEVQKSICDELNKVFKGSDRDVEKRDLVQLKYLEAVIKETMRLYPSIPLVARKLDKDVKIKNYTLPSGRRCFVFLYGVNRHPVWGPDAEQFRPERWLAPASLPDQKAFAAFGMGKRKCIGHNFAMMSLKTTLAHVLRRYRVFGDITQLEQTMEIVARPVSKDYICIEKRRL